MILLDVTPEEYQNLIISWENFDSFLRAIFFPINDNEFVIDYFDIENE